MGLQGRYVSVPNNAEEGDVPGEAAGVRPVIRWHTDLVRGAGSANVLRQSYRRWSATGRRVESKRRCPASGNPSTGAPCPWRRPTAKLMKVWSHRNSHAQQPTRA
jgi:hypothetical protein